MSWTWSDDLPVARTILARVWIGELASDKRDSSTRGAFLLELAAAHGLVEDVRQLYELDENAPGLPKMCCAAAHAAASRQQWEEVYYLLGKGVHMHSRGYVGTTIFMHACGSGSLLLVKDLVARGADARAKDDRGSSALYRAAYHNRLSIVEYLIDAIGLDVNEVDIDGTPLLNRVSTPSPMGFEPFPRTGIVGSLLPLVQLLIDRGADVNARDKYGSTPIFFALLERKFEMLEYLLERGADPDSPEDHHRTLLMYLAPRPFDPHAFRLLIDGGASLTALDLHNRVPLHHACSAGNEDMLQRLLALGAPFS